MRSSRFIYYLFVYILQGSIARCSEILGSPKGLSEDLLTDSCESPIQRQEWSFKVFSQQRELANIFFRRYMSRQLQTEYLDAVTCLMRLPSITMFDGAQTRFDDFQALHVALTYGIHWVVSHGFFHLHS